MKQVSQTIVDKGRGNCMQAAIASLFDCELEEVPNFIEYPTNWFSMLYTFVLEKGYDYNGTLDHKATLNHYSFDSLRESDGVNGLFYASVYSPKYNPMADLDGTTHAVIIDKNFRIIWDPNPEYMKYHISGEPFNYPGYDNGYNGILNIYLIEKNEN